MDRRMFDMTDYYKDSIYSSRKESDFPKCSIDKSYCVQAPSRDYSDVLTMAFVNMQPIESVYETEQGFSKGSLFPNIDKPLLGGNKR